MKRTVLLAALLVAIACTMALSTAKPLYALFCCDCPGCYATVQHWVMRPTCSEAQTAYRAETLPEAQADCGGPVCSFSIPACYASGDQWVVDGIATYGCRYDCGPPIP